MSHIHATERSGAAYFADPPAGPVVMLNLLRFAETADYSASPELAPDEPISGRAAYARYSEHTLPLLAAAGGRVIFSGSAEHFLIGPMEETWDHVLLVRYPSAQAFLGFASDSAYLAGAGHRTAALADSRLLPMTPEGDEGADQPG